jgi:hypothetical protein
LPVVFHGAKLSKQLLAFDDGRQDKLLFEENRG